MEKITYDSWDNYDEDYYPAGDDHELEYEEEYEDEDEEYEHQYAAVQGNWDPREYDDPMYGTKKVVKKVRSVKTVELAKEKARKHWEKKRRQQSQEREKQRQAYYHYSNNDDDIEEDDD